MNPGREMGEGAAAVTGITAAMLSDAPDFGDRRVVEALLDFFGDDPIVAHNAEFDRGFLNAELARIGRDPLPASRFIDTVPIARQHRPGAPASLDAVCKRFGISIEGRELHGALKDARLLAMAYLELRGGRMRSLEFEPVDEDGVARGAVVRRAPRPRPLASRLTEAELEAHAAMIAELGDQAIWKRYTG